MRRKIKAIAIIVLLLSISLVITGCGRFKEDMKNLFKKPIEFSCGAFHPSTEELSISISAEEISLLDGFEGLSVVDFTNSTCYEEIAAWADSNSCVKVLCSVPLPNGDSVQLLAEKLDLSGLTHTLARPMAEALRQLPRLREVNLGKRSDEENSLLFEDLLWLKYLNPTVYFICDECVFNAFGQTISLRDIELDLSEINSSDTQLAMNLISMMPNLSTIEFGKDSKDLLLEDICRFQTVFSDIDINYEFTLYGKTFSINDEVIDLSFMAIEDRGEALREVLPYLPRCSYVDMDSCGISNEDMAKLQAEFPHVKLVWRVFFGHAYTLRTDAERLLASRPSVGGNLTAADLADLKYCTDLKYLDIGHNMNVGSLEFLAPLAKLEVVVLAMNSFTDLSPLANCHNIEYLEIYTTETLSVEPLRNLTKLKHLNIGNTRVSDISPLYGLDLDRLFIGATTPVPAEQVAVMQGLHPDCEINTVVSDPAEGSWRYGKTNCWPWIYHERYALLREQMGYDGLEYNFKWSDKRYMEHFG